MDISFINNSRDEIRDKIINITKEYTGITNMKDTGVLRGIMEVFTEVVTLSYQAYVNDFYKQAIISTATGDFLDSHGSLVGIYRHAANKAKGYVEFQAYSDGVLKAGTKFNFRDLNINFIVKADSEFHRGTCKIYVESEGESEKYNLAPGSEVKLITSIEGLTNSSFRMYYDWLTEYGSEAESDEHLRDRIKKRWASLSIETNPSKYESIALSITGVSQAKIIRAVKEPNDFTLFVHITNKMERTSVIDKVRAEVDVFKLYSKIVSVSVPYYQKLNLQVVYEGDIEVEDLKGHIMDYVDKLEIGENFIETKFTALLLKTLSNLATISLLNHDAGQIEFKAFNKFELGELEVTKHES